MARRGGAAFSKDVKEAVTPVPVPVPVPVSAPASNIVSQALLTAVQRVIGQAETRGAVCNQEYLQSALAQYSLPELLAALQTLINQFDVRVVRGNGSGGKDDFAYVPMAQDVGQALKGLSAEEMLVYRLVESSQREGMWAKTLKTKANIVRTFPKVMKHLEAKRLVKCFKSIQSKYKKIYILYDLEPAEHHKGGVWYDAKLEFDKSFVETLKTLVLDFVRSEGGTTLASIQRNIEQRGVSQVALGENEVRALANALRYDGLLECSGVGPHAIYKTAFTRDRSAVVLRGLGSALSTPCLHCPVLHLCGESDDVTPSKCVYLTPWLDF